MSDCDEAILKLSIAILVVGTRGDVQPFLAVARKLQEYGHRVRLATHSMFDEFVKSAGIDFYPLGGDPRIFIKGIVQTKRRTTEMTEQFEAVIDTLLPACTQSDPITDEPFRAQAIIANPPTRGCKDLAEFLAIPLHICFINPWTPTSAFPHFLALPKLTLKAGYWISYYFIDLVMWWTVRCYLNNWRKNKLNLGPNIGLFNTSRISISNLPTTYLWSPHVLPKPNDWGPLVDVVGYSFVDLGSKYEPPQALVQWIQKGPAPIYVGFGSMCYALVHHGGAGTTACGLKAGCPSTIVPFFGDLFMWGAIVHAKGIGPAPIPISQLTADSLSEAIRFMLQPQVKSRAMELAVCIEGEDGAGAAVNSFHRHLRSELASLEEKKKKEKEEEKEKGIVDFVQSFFGYFGYGDQIIPKNKNQSEPKRNT